MNVAFSFNKRPRESVVELGGGGGGGDRWWWWRGQTEVAKGTE